MDNFKACTDQFLITHTKELVERERKITAEVLDLLREIERRRLFAARGYSSLHQFVVQELKYSDGAAHRRISSMRLVKDLPQAQAAIEEGSLSLSTAATLQTFFRNEQKDQGKQYSQTEKEKIMTEAQGKSKREVEKQLAEISPKAIPNETERTLTATKTQISLVADESLMQKINRIHELKGHKLSYAELFEKLCDFMLDKTDPLRKAAKNAKRAKQTQQTKPASPENPMAKPQMNARPEFVGKAVNRANLETKPAEQHSTSKAFEPMSEQQPPYAAGNFSIPSPEKPPAQPSFNTKTSRYIPQKLKQAVWVRDRGQCTYIDSVSGRRCESRHALQLDHILPLVFDGPTELDNLRLICFAHNQWLAIDSFGRHKMKNFCFGL